MRNASDHAAYALTEKQSIDVFSRLSPLFESESEADGWQRCVDIARELFAADNAGAVEFNGTDTVIVRAASGREIVPVGTSIPVGNASHSVEPDKIGDVLVINDLVSEEGGVRNTMLLSSGIRSCAILSLRLADGHLVIIGVNSFEPNYFVDEDVASLRVLGEVFTSAINQLRAPAVSRSQTHVDPLTGLLDRLSSLTHLDERLDAGSQPAALVVNLDGFKSVNVELGQRSGDIVLQTIAQRIEQATGPHDVVGRLSGDEFLVLAADGEGELLAERLVARIEATIALETRTAQISAAIGIGRPRHGDDALAVIGRADRLMRQAKQAGRGEIRADVAAGPSFDATPTTSSSAAAIRPKHNMLDAAIAGLRIVVQPIVDARTGRIHGIETLARGPVDHPLEYPDRLFSAARTLDRLGDVELAAKRLSFSLELPPEMHLYVNLEPSLLCDSDWMNRLHDAWRAGSQHPLVTTEVTERDVMGNPGRLLRAVEICRELGWKIALDDVGSRSECLASLRWIDPDVVKLDMSLITNDNPAHTAHVVAAVSAYRDMQRHGDVTVIAEGVETTNDAQHADGLGADLLQGYLFGRPGPIDELDLLGLIAPAGVAPEPLLEGDRVTTKSELIAMTRHVESTATTPDTVVIASVQHAANVSRATQHQYRDLARRCGFVGMVGTGVRDRFEGELPGVRTADLESEDPMVKSWRVVAMSPTASIGLLATEVTPQDENAEDSDRLFRYRFITDAGEVETAVRELLRYF